MKLCRVCGAEKDLSDFYRRAENRDGHCSECKACLGVRTAEAQKANPDGRRKKVNAWRAKNVDRERQRNRDRYPAMKSYYAGKQKEERAERPHLYLTRMARRRARKKEACPLWVDHEEIAGVYRDAAAAGLTVDHIIPLAGKTVCGLHVPWNLQLLSQADNSKKGNRLCST